MVTLIGHYYHGHYVHAENVNNYVRDNNVCGIKVRE